jgi:hypothetical protein
MRVPESEHRPLLIEPASRPTDGAVPTGNNPKIEDRAGSSLSRNVAAFWAARDLCKSIIESTPRQLPAVRPFEQEGQLDIQRYMFAAYGQIRYTAYAPLAVRLIEAYLGPTANIRPALLKAMDAIFTMKILDRIPMLELLIQAHELTIRPEEPVDETSLTAKTRLLDIISRHDTYLPVTSRQTFFLFGSRFGSGSIKEYAEAWNQLQGDAEVEVWDGCQIARFYLELVLCVAEHLCGH